MMSYKVNFCAVLLLLLTVTNNVDCGVIAFGICEATCNNLATACYTKIYAGKYLKVLATGFTIAPLTLGLGTPVAVLACNAAFAECMSSCVLAGLSPLL
ncbi:unnamed protein product [Chironomus riparius]|uniref:Uncharacterized protein n=1 Tax=Chironomus riparius TaxID=315576 RepID=A0A9N9S1Q4_9DIPT|nr:unnamed protein product [Chironomus riparius]